MRTRYPPRDVLGLYLSYVSPSQNAAQGHFKVKIPARQKLNLIPVSIPYLGTSAVEPLIQSSKAGISYVGGPLRPSFSQQTKT